METSEENFGERIRRLRGTRSQLQLARAVGVTKATISKWEHEYTQGLRTKTLFKLADALGVDPRELATGEKGEPKASAPLPAGMLAKQASPAVAVSAPPHLLDFVRMYVGLPDELRAEVRELIEMVETFASRKP